MLKSCRLIFLLCLLMRTIVADSLVRQQNQKHLTSLALKICKETVRQSGQALFYLTDFTGSHLITPIIPQLHASSIQTIMINHPSELSTLEIAQHNKNMIFFLDDVDELLNLILHSDYKQTRNFASNSCEGFTHCKQTAKKLYSVSFIKNQYDENNYMPRYCVQIGDDDEPSLVNYRKICDLKIRITTAELENTAFLTNSTYHLTRHLYINNIWNSKNRIIFMLKKSSRNGINSKYTTPVDKNATQSNKIPKVSNLVPYFKFMWRFFRGMKTVICHASGCERYDPFTENILRYSGKDREEYFDFSWNDMHGKTIGHLPLDYQELNLKNERFQLSGVLNIFLQHIYNALETSLNCRIVSSIITSEDMTDRAIEIGQKFGTDLRTIHSAVFDFDDDTSKFEFSLAIESNALCIAAPLSSFVPQWLVVFRSFTPIGWILISVVFTVFVLAHHVYQLSQCGVFKHLYPRGETAVYENTSSLLTVYSYLINGSPPRVVLGRLITGRILFAIFSFSAIVISTILQGRMTDLLTSKIRYPEIETLKDLEESGLFLQVMDEDTSSGLFASRARLRSKLCSHLNHYVISVFYHLEENLSIRKRIFNGLGIPMNSTEDADQNHIAEDIFENMRVIMETDAILVNVPHYVLARNAESNVLLKNWLFQAESEHHLIKQCLIGYPVLYGFVKNLFFFEKINQIVGRFFEAGHMEKALKTAIESGALQFRAVSVAKNDPKALTLHDVQPAFVSLVIGLFLSFLTFIAELMADLFRNTKTYTFIRQIKTYICCKL
ncbi:unnamed protein product [Bemisia tabaci]|uniref:Ionotropic receptor n=1 Tax=Bemisia tabaci TaxID=7038 RepID=A0A9P0CB06_BEMTA|nr:unnamed protein product [Bemisia tabaci]